MPKDPRKKQPAPKPAKAPSKKSDATCIACQGTGKNSKGMMCAACRGKGTKQQPQTDRRLL